MLTTDPPLRDHYGHFYSKGQSEWRRISAKDKAKNVLDLCANVPLETGSSEHQFQRGRIIEIGAGDGALLGELASAGFGEALFAAEISDTAIEVIRRRQVPRLVDVIKFDGYRLPAAAHQFDLAILSHVVEHVEHPRALLREAARVARYVFVEVPLELHWRTPRDYRWTDTGHINLFNAKVIRHLIQSTGLPVIFDRISAASLKTMVFHYGSSGYLRFGVRRVALIVARPFATQVMTYNWSGVAKSPNP